MCLLLPQVETFRVHKLCEDEGPSRLNIPVQRCDLLRYYSDMVTVREIEKKTKQLYREQKIRGFCHIYSGQVCYCV